MFCFWKTTVSCLLFVWLFSVPARATEGETTLEPAYQALLKDACEKPLVLIGEADHFAGASFQAKATLVRALIEQCGFQQVVFESSLYESLNLQRAYAQGRATEAMLFNLIGGFWATTAELQDLLPFLHRRAQSGELRVSGMDAQFGGTTNLYEQRGLAGELTAVLPESQRAGCQALAQRLIAWEFTAQQPDDAAFRERLLVCAENMSAAHPDNASQPAAQMARNFLAWLKVPSADPRSERDRLMFENLRTAQQADSTKLKTIVWTHNAHLMKQAIGEWLPLGALLHAAGEQTFSLAIVAQQGAVKRQPNNLSFDKAAPDSVEGSVAFAPNTHSAYLSQAQLRSLGERASRMEQLPRFETRNWADRVDGVLVLREERPPVYVYPRKARE